MNHRWLILLAVTLGAAPAATVQTGMQEMPATQDLESDAPSEDPEPRKVPQKAQWGKLTPGLVPGSTITPDADDEGGDRPELPPALYARRLAAELLPPAPCEAPPRAALRAGYLCLPPPA
ncbi:MAG: hypothetical protein AAGD14_14820 [Planctomycetota bacterium]